MKFKIVAVGKIKEAFFRQAIEEYSKRVSKFAKLEIVEVGESFFNGTPNQSESEKILANEAQAMLPHLTGFVVMLDIKGKQLGSVEMSKLVEQQKQNSSTITFVIGSSHGIDQKLKTQANLLWSLGEITLPHQLARVVLCEQIYRMCCIEVGSAYHK